ncbi:MAG: HD domain-containing protein [Rikenellaceae bacterium]
MTTNKIANLAIEYYSKYPSTMRDDILHTQEVVCYTRMIAIGEGLSPKEVEMQEAAAWLHDIGCPRSKELYGNSLPQNQQSVGRDVAHELLQNVAELTADEKGWLVDVVGTHHQFADSQKLSFAPLFEADLIVNILSGYFKKEQAENLYKTLVTSKTGQSLFKGVVCKALNIQF